MDERKPLSVGEILDRGFSVYRRALAGVAPLTLIEILIMQSPRFIFSPESLQPGKPGSHFGSYMLMVFVLSLVAVAFRVAVIRKLDDVDESRNALSALQAFTGGLPYFLRALGSSLLYGLACAVGFVLLIVPGIYLGLALSLSLYAVILENSGASASLSRSRALVRDNWWRLAGIFTVAAAIYMVVYAAVGALIALLLPGGHMLALVTGKVMPDTLGTVLATLFLAVCNALLLPILYSISLVAFRDLQLRKGGGDLAARIAATA